jgi:hypothetical protein
MWFAVALAAGCTAGAISAAQDFASATTQAQAADGRYISWREHLVDDQLISGIELRG